MHLPYFNSLLNILVKQWPVTRPIIISMLIDCHAHLNFQAYNKDKDEVIARCSKMKVINIGSQFPTSLIALELANEHSNFYASVGLHPVHAMGQDEDKNEIREKIDMNDEEQLAKIRELLESDENNRITAVGETGFDYYRLGIKNEALVIRERQKEIFLKHIELAKEFKKPLMLHCRGSKDKPQEAYDELLKTLNASKALSNKGVIHCFSSSLDIAKKFISLGFHIGFTGIITFPNAGGLVKVVEEMPLDKILLETDCPYLAPQQVRGQRNEPQYVEYVYRKVAEIKKVSYDEVAEKVEENVKKLFGI